MKTRRQLWPSRLFEPRRLSVHLSPPADTSRLPPIASDRDGAEEDATDDWLAHIQAGRIEVK